VAETFSVAGRFRLIQALEVWIHEIADPRNSESFPLKTGFLMPRFPLKQVPLYITFRIDDVWTLLCSLYIIPNTTFRELQVCVLISFVLDLSPTIQFPRQIK
jgi:hypothetical protein